MHFYDFNYDIGKTCISCLFYSPARPSCLMRFCLVLDAEPAGVEAERAFEVVEPPAECEW